ncbi:MAG: sulfate permease [Luminiphilus sp.]|nr:sulfate permease [Luminiphilus sp.]
MIKLPCWNWLRHYNPQTMGNDMVAAMIVTVMLIPQSLAYALLAGLPPEMGLYASILPLIAYAIFGTSRTLSVGPVAVVSLMTATAVGKVAQQGTVDYATAAITLALLSGLILLLLGFIRFGFVTNFLSHPVVSGFITASGVLIALSQLSHILGIDASGETLPELTFSLATMIDATNPYTLSIGLCCLLVLHWSRCHLAGQLERLGMATLLAETFARCVPVAVIALSTLIAYVYELNAHGVALVGAIPQGMPAFTQPHIEWTVIRELILPALLVALIGFVESVSVGRTLGAKRRERIDANQELIGLGAANLASAFSGGFPVTGGFSRSVVNFDAGAKTQAASAFTAVGIALAALFLTPALYHLPKVTLAATIVIAVSTLIDWKMIKAAWDYDHADFMAIVITIVLTLTFGVEIGVMSGISASISLHLYRTMRPHFAIVGTVPGTEHYRNIDRHDVLTHNNILSIRIDESLYFANAAFLEEIVDTELAQREGIEHIILMCPAVNMIDLSAVEALQEVNSRLLEREIKLHLSEVKGPVMDALKRSEFLRQLGGNVYLSHHAAVLELTLES